MTPSDLQPKGSPAPHAAQAPQRVLIVEDDPAFRSLLHHELEPLGITLEDASTLAEARAALGASRPDLLLLDLGLPDGDGRALLGASAPAVVLTAADEPGLAEACLAQGALDFVPKPFEPLRLLASVRGALRQAELQQTVSRIEAAQAQPRGLRRLVGASPAMARVVDLLRRAAGTQITVLITGDSGTGKEVAARALHEESDRAERPFIALNCGAIPETLIESELFGHERGAFTGATRERPGCFEAADGGTLFLDEIGELPRDLQVKLLRVLQEREVVRVGGSAPRPVDVRVIAATNRDLAQDRERGAFREDLYYRIAVFPVHMPPLRQRADDVLLLTRTFLAQLARRHGRAPLELPEETRQALLAHGWRGNVRELENTLERALLLTDGRALEPASLDLQRGDAGGAERPSPAGAPTASGPFQRPAHREDLLPLAEVERAWLERALELCEGNAREVARRLGIGRATVARRLERYRQ
ncbi:MAG: sigma-54-dependent Fis family transcriptional regulator [Planctomycetes bacterium]|nr:sigma-54-dependent Fis family transcriptional regulator [Planctomycetota bacterium]